MCDPPIISAKGCGSPPSVDTFITADLPPHVHRKISSRPYPRIKWPVTPTFVNWRGLPPSAFMTQTSNLPLWSDWKAIREPSGEKKGLTFMLEFKVKRRNAPLEISASQTFGFPERDEKKTIFFASGDQFGWKSPPGPVVS